MIDGPPSDLVSPDTQPTPPTGSGGPPADIAGGVGGPAPAPQPGPPKHTSQVLGLEEAVMHPMERAAAAGERALNFIPTPWGQAGDVLERLDDVGSNQPHRNVAEATHDVEAGFRAREAAGEQPGAFGKIAGDVIGTAPAALATKNPYLAGAGIGALESDATDAAGVARDAIIGSVTSKLANVGLDATGKHILEPAAEAVSRRLARYGLGPDQLSAAQDRAYYYVRNLIQNAAKTPDDIRAAAEWAFGKPITSAEAIGRPGIQAATALGRREGASPDLMETQLNERAAHRFDRILGDYADHSGIDPAAAQGNMEQVIADGQRNAAPLYQKAFAHPAPVSDVLDRLRQNPDIVAGIKAGLRAERNNADAAGRPFDPKAYGISGFDPAGDPIIGPNPTYQTWDTAKRGLDDMIEGAKKTPTGRLDYRGQSLVNLKQGMLKELDALNPDYAAARSASSDYLSANQAYQDGQKSIFASTITAKQFAAKMAKLSPSDAEAFKGGIANALFNKAQNGAIPPGTFITAGGAYKPIIQQKLEAALGADNAKTFLQKMKVEADLSKWGARMAPGTNSVTGDIINATNEQDRTGAAVQAIWGIGNLLHGNWGSGQAHLAQSLRKLGAWGATSGMPVSVRDEAGRLLMMHPSDLADYIQAMDARFPHQAMRRLFGAMSTLKTPVRSAITSAPHEAMKPDVNGSQQPPQDAR